MRRSAVAVSVEVAPEVRAQFQKTSKRKPSKRRVQQVERLIIDHRENGRKLARSILRRWRVRMPLEEVDSLVDLTLCEAANRYEESKGASFMTFFFYHLRGHLVRAVAAAANANQIFMAFAKSSGLEIGDWSPTNEDQPYTAAPEFDLFGQRDIETPEQQVIRKERIEKCREAVDRLDQLERDVLFRSFNDEQALVEIAAELGYSRCHISRVKRQALERMEALVSNSGLNDDESKDVSSVRDHRLENEERRVSKRWIRRRRSSAKSSEKKTLRRVA